jgi:predicted glycoside hydrolase/deacetylase ChbG (UPF0249 family)
VGETYWCFDPVKQEGDFVDGKRYLVVTADDYGIGPATSQGILDLADRGLVTSAVLLVNSPHAGQAVRAWRQAGMPMELGWHPCLTLDEPVAPATKVPTLLGADGRFHRLGTLIRKLLLNRLRPAEIELELQAQYHRFHDFLGHPPTVVNSHHHVQVFQPIGGILRGVLRRAGQAPYMRRIREPWRMLARVPGARRKRLVLNWFGRREARQQEQEGFSGNDWLAGITDPPWVRDVNFLKRWLTRIPGQVVELTCHPGHHDTTLLGRDCTPEDGQLQRRVNEFQLLMQANFKEAYQEAGFTLATPAELPGLRLRGQPHAA